MPETIIDILDQRATATPNQLAYIYLIDGEKTNNSLRAASGFVRLKPWRTSFRNRVERSNRGPAVFDDPESLRFDRKYNPHINFGHSFHHCLGARLARDEMQIAFARFVAHFPNVRLYPQRPPVWRI